MNFAARQLELKERLTWAPSRGPKRQALLDELRRLVRDELAREVSASGQPRSSITDVNDEPDTPPADEPPRLYAREPYWINS